MNFQQKPSKEAIQSWYKCVKTKEDVYNWHTQYTPWITHDQIMNIIQLYDQQLIDLNQEQSKIIDQQIQINEEKQIKKVGKQMMSEFKTLLLDS